MGNQNFSRSEKSGFTYLPDTALSIYSAGISTGGFAEINMLDLKPEAHIVATTLDESGLAYSRQIVDAAGLSNRIEMKLEDVSSDLAYDAGSFDYVYARLVLHYLTKQTLPVALDSLYRVLKPSGRLFVVVRSVDCFDTARESATYDDTTGLTRYIGSNGQISHRFFHTQQSISEAIIGAGFTIESVEQYDEQLYIDYERKHLTPHSDNLIEVRSYKD